VAAHDQRTYAHLLTPQGLAGIAQYAQAIGPAKSLGDSAPRRRHLGEPTGSSPTRMADSRCTLDFPRGERISA
jgi:hypothetical protein